MRWKLAQLFILATASLLGGQQSTYAQQPANAPCPTPHEEVEAPAGPEISIADVTFSGSLQIPISDQHEIASSIEEKTRGISLDLVREEALERARAGWQDRGYFKVQIDGDTKTLTSSPTGQRIALSIHVIDEGAQYSLGRITFKHNKAISNGDTLRGLFPIADGEIFSRDKIATGLENLRKAYDELGYINFTSVPDTRFDDANRRISLFIDIDEGKQFRVVSVDLLGFDEPSRQEILNDFPIGQVYNPKLFELLFVKQYSILRIPPDDPWHTMRRLDEKAGTVAITLDARPCLE